MNAPCPSGSFIVMSISRLLISKACKGCTSHETWFCRKGSATPISWERGAWCCFGPTMITYSIGHFPVARILFSGQTLYGNCLLPAKPQAGCETASVSTWTGLYQNLQRTERRGQQQRASHRRLWSAVHLDRYTGCYSSRCHCRPSIRDPPQRSLNITTHSQKPRCSCSDSEVIGTAYERRGSQNASRTQEGPTQCLVSEWKKKRMNKLQQHRFWICSRYRELFWWHFAERLELIIYAPASGYLYCV